LAETAEAASTVPWHAVPVEQVFTQLATAPEGLTDEEAARRLAEHGPNALPPPRRVHPVVRFLRQFHSALIYFLLGGALAAVLLGHTIDAAVILVVVIANATVGFVQEGKAEQALAAIAGMIAPHAVRPARRRAPAAPRAGAGARRRGAASRPETACRRTYGSRARAGCWSTKRR